MPETYGCIDKNLLDGIILSTVMERFNRLDMLHRANAYKKINELLDEFEKNPSYYLSDKSEE